MKTSPSIGSRVLLFLILAAWCAPLAAKAQNPGLVSYTGGSTFATFQADGDTVGWAFSLNQSITVSQLGFNDVTPADPLTVAHLVGLWDSAGNLLASIMIQPGSNLINGFRYEAIAPIVLAAGQTYILGAFYAADNTTADGYVTGATSATFDPVLNFLGPRRDPDGAQTGLVFPSVVSAGNGRFGPNMLFTVVPEPATYALLGAGLTIVGIRFRRRRSS